MAAEPFFLQVDSGARFCLFHPPQLTEAKGAVLYIHPFAEEMNKSRRMAALQARALAVAGYAVLQLDLHGCGDSSGDFGDASWQDWVSDVVAGHACLRERCDAPFWLWGLRAGCLIASAAARLIDDDVNLLFWQGAPAGKPLMQQFLRLKVAGALMGGEAKGVTQDLRRELAAGNAIEIAGYTLAPPLVDGFEQAQLLPAPNVKRLEWLEISSRPEAALSPVSAKTLQQWQDAGCKTRSRIVNGAAFWQTAEIEEVPALLSATLEAMVSQ